MKPPSITRPIGTARNLDVTDANELIPVSIIRYPNATDGAPTSGNQL